MRHELVPPLLPLPAPPSLRSDWTAEGGCPYNSRSLRWACFAQDDRRYARPSQFPNWDLCTCGTDVLYFGV